jgi:hypothetical protein
MKQEGPLLESLMRRLAETPDDFLLEPRIGAHGVIHVPAVVADLLRDLGGAGLDAKDAKTFESGERDRLTLILIASWLLHHEFFVQAQSFADGVLSFLTSGLDEVAGLVDPKQFVSDPDRREELARRVLRGLDLRPAGESAKQATDRLNTLDSVERIRILRDTRAAQERIRKIQEAMQKKAAEEAAAAYGRE